MIDNVIGEVKIIEGRQYFKCIVVGCGKYIDVEDIEIGRMLPCPNCGQAYLKGNIEIDISRTVNVRNLEDRFNNQHLSSKVLLEQTMYAYRNTKVKIFPKDNPRHHLPHFHIESNYYNATFNIKDCSLIVESGKKSRAILKHIKDWWTENKDSLLYEWNKYNS